MAKYLTYLLRLIVFSKVLFVVLRQTQLNLLKEAISNCSMVWLLPAFLFCAGRYFIQSIRWHLAAKAHGHQLPLKMTVRAQIEIAFLEIVFPLPDSDNGLKAIYMSRQKIPLSASIAIILYDRIIGISILLLLLPFAILLVAKNIVPPYLQTGWAITLFLIVVLPLSAYHRVIIGQLLTLFQKYFTLKKIWMQTWCNELQKKINFGFVASGILLTLLNALFTAAAGVLHFIFHIIIIAMGGCVYSLNPESNSMEVVISKPLRKLLGRIYPFQNYSYA